MLVPVLLRLPSEGSAHTAHAAHVGHTANADDAVSSTVDASRLYDLASIGIHTLAMFAVMALIALVIYEKLGLTILRRSWFNLDRVWAGALVTAGVLTLAFSLG